MALVLVFEEKNFPLPKLKEQLDLLTDKFSFLYENLTELDGSPVWRDCTVAAVDVRAPSFLDHHTVFHYLIVDLVHELPELLVYSFDPLLDVKDIGQEHLATEKFRLALPF